jgi:hypothetical protein
MLVLTMWKAYVFDGAYDTNDSWTHSPVRWKRPVHQLSGRRLIYELQAQEYSRTEEVPDPKNASNTQYKNRR